MTLRHPDQLAIQEVTARLAATDLQPQVLTDLDLTLFDKFVFDPQANTRLPHVSPELMAASKDCPIIAATSRLAHNPVVDLLWRSGIVALDQPIITEGGGTIVTRRPDGSHAYDDQVGKDHVDALANLRESAESSKLDLPVNHRLIWKIGRTTMVAAIQDEQDNRPEAWQHLLAEHLRTFDPAASLDIIDTRVSVAIQHPGVSKGKTYLKHLTDEGIDPASLYTVGMGDGLNDKGLFKVANLGIGFSPAVRHLVDLEVSGPQAAPPILAAVANRARQLRQR